MAFTLRAQSADYSGAPPPIAPNPLAVEAGDVLVVAFLVFSDDEIDTPADMGTLAVSQGAESQALVWDSQTSLEFSPGVFAFTLVLATCTIDAPLAAEIVAGAGFSFGGTGPTFAGATIHHTWSFAWWWDTDNVNVTLTQDGMGGTDTVNGVTVQTLSESAAFPQAAGDAGMYGVFAEGTTVDNTINALTLAFASVDSSSSLSRNAGSNFWHAARSAVGTGTGSVAGDTVDWPDDQITDYGFFTVSMAAAAAEPTTGDPSFQLAPRARKVFVQELPYGVHSGMVGGLQPQRRQLDNTRKQRDARPS